MDALIATHGRPDLLRETINALSEGHRSGFIHKLVLVENGGDFGARDLCKSFGSNGFITYLSSEFANKSHALNVGLAHCSDGLVFMTDDDIQVEATTLGIYSDVSKDFAEGGYYFGGPTEAVLEKAVPEYIKTLMPRSAKGWTSNQEEVNRDGLFIGFNWAAFKKDLIEAGGFNPDFGPGSNTGATGQESDMQRRLLAIGKKPKYLSDAPVSHMVPAERYNDKWLIHRSYRQGVEKGIRAGKENLEKAKEYCRKQTFQFRLKHVILKFHYSSAHKFRNIFHLEKLRGYKKGLNLIDNKELLESPFFDFRNPN